MAENVVYFVIINKFLTRTRSLKVTETAQDFLNKEKVINVILKRSKRWTKLYSYTGISLHCGSFKINTLCNHWSNFFNAMSSNIPVHYLKKLPYITSSKYYISLEKSLLTLYYTCTSNINICSVQTPTLSKSVRH